MWPGSDRAVCFSIEEKGLADEGSHNRRRGFIGSHVVDAYLEQGHKVLVVYDLSHGNLRNIDPRADFEEANVADGQEIARTLSSSQPKAVNWQLTQIFGTGFEGGSSILVALSCTQLVNVAVGGVGYILIMTGRQTWELRNSLALGGLNVLLNLVLIRSYGALGAGITAAVALALISVVRLIEVWVAFGFHPYSREYFKPLAAAGISLVGWCILRSIVPPRGWSWLGGAAAMLVLYVLCLLVLYQ